jgi:hypothetical protein
MKARLLGCVLILGLGLFGQSRSEEVRLQPGSKLWIEGNSTLHAWSAEARQLLLTASAKPSETPLRWDISSLTLRIPVRGLSSGKKGLDENMWEDLKAERYPEIVFRLKEYRLSGQATAEGATVQVEGWLTVAGTEKPVSFPVAWSVQGDRIRIRGSTELRMTDFGIKPRTFMAFMKVDNRVVVHFDCLFEIR